jgi:hypothetical protein
MLTPEQIELLVEKHWKEDEEADPSDSCVFQRLHNWMTRAIAAEQELAELRGAAQSGKLTERVKVKPSWEIPVGERKRELKRLRKRRKRAR